MSSKTTEQALIQIEKNLDKLESARKQVLDVTKSAGEIGAIMVQLVKKVEELHDSINLESASLVEGFDQNQKKLDQHTSQILAKSKQSTEDLVDRFDKLNSKITEKINKTIDLNSTKSREFLKDQKETLNDHKILLADFSDSVERLQRSMGEVDFTKQLAPLENKLDANFESFNEKSEASQLDLTKKVSQILDPVDRKFAELSNALNTLTQNNLSLHNESTKNITAVINDLHKQNLALQERNTELLEVISKKKEFNVLYFYLTWLVLFCGFLISVFIIKRF